MCILTQPFPPPPPPPLSLGPIKGVRGIYPLTTVILK